MPDPWSSTASLDEAIQHRLADVLSTRASDPQQQEMADRYLSDLKLPAGARVVEIGCGTGIVCRRIAEQFPAVEVLGVDPSRVFVSLAREQSKATRENNLTNYASRGLRAVCISHLPLIGSNQGTTLSLH